MATQKEYNRTNARASTVFPHGYFPQRIFKPSPACSSMRFSSPPEAEWIRRDAMAQRVDKIRYSGRVPYDTNKMVLTRASISHDLVAVVSADNLEIQRIETCHDQPSKVPLSQRASQDCDTEEKLQDNNGDNVDLAHMMITSSEQYSTTSDDHLQIPEEESHNGEQVSLKQCIL